MPCPRCPPASQTKDPLYVRFAAWQIRMRWWISGICALMLFDEMDIRALYVVRGTTAERGVFPVYSPIHFGFCARFRPDVAIRLLIPGRAVGRVESSGEVGIPPRWCVSLRPGLLVGRRHVQTNHGARINCSTRAKCVPPGHQQVRGIPPRRWIGSECKTRNA
jgi:hypothetical protein